jgi:transposase
MARKNYLDEFNRDAVALYRDSRGATISVIAAKLGVSEATLSAWCKSARRVPTQQRKHGSVSGPAPGQETAEHELARLRAENWALRADKNRLSTERGHSAVGGQVFRRGDELVSRFQFVADHLHAVEVKWLCAVVEFARSSFYAWLGRR